MLGDGAVAVYSLKGGDRAAAACLQRFPMRHVATRIRSSLSLLSLLTLRHCPCAPAPTLLNPITLSPNSCATPASLPSCLAEQVKSNFYITSLSEYIIELPLLWRQLCLDKYYFCDLKSTTSLVYITASSIYFWFVLNPSHGWHLCQVHLSYYQISTFSANICGLSMFHVSHISLYFASFFVAGYCRAHSWLMRENSQYHTTSTCL